MKLRCPSPKRKECSNLGGDGREGTAGKWFGKTWVSSVLLQPIGEDSWTTVKIMKKECQTDYYTWIKSTQLCDCCGCPPQTAVQLASAQFCILFETMTLHLSCLISHEHGFIFTVRKLNRKTWVRACYKQIVSTSVWYPNQFAGLCLAAACPRS